MSHKEQELYGDELVKTRYWQLQLEAREKHSEGRKRKAADMFRECLTISPTKWSDERFNILSIYGWMLCHDKEVEATEDDIDFLEKNFVDNNAEPNIFRLVAAIDVMQCKIIIQEKGIKEGQAFTMEQPLAVGKKAIALSKTNDPDRLKHIKALRPSPTGKIQVCLVQDLYHDLKGRLEDIEKLIKHDESQRRCMESDTLHALTPSTLRNWADFVSNHINKMNDMRYFHMNELCVNLGYKENLDFSRAYYVSWLEKLVSNTEEPMVFRCRAACTLLQIAWNQNDHRAVKKYRQLARLCMAQTREEERTAIVRTRRKYLGAEMPRPMDVSVQRVYKDLTEMYLSNDGPKQDQVAHGEMCLSQEEADNIFRLEKTDIKAFRRRMVAGGDECDFCDRKKEEVGLKRLAACARCNRASYCSRECQRKHWEAGHKIACRKPEGDIHPGDLMKLINLAKKEFNLRVVKVVRADPNKQGRWEVMFFDNGKTGNASIASEKLMHLRPVG